MIPLEEYKKCFSKTLLKKLTEEQILKLRENQDQMAEIFFNMWLEDLKSKQ